MKHISEILKQITNDEGQYLMAYLRDIEAENLKLRGERLCMCGIAFKHDGTNRKLCDRCRKASKVYQAKKLAAKTGERVKCECIQCGIDITVTRIYANKSRCEPCKWAHIKTLTQAALSAKKSYKSKVDPMGALLSERGVSFDSYNIPSTNKVQWRC